MEKKTDLRLDAVTMVRRIRDAQHERLEGKTWEERAAFFRDRAAELGAALRESKGSGAQESAR
jgi:hypothetical protein